MYFNSGYLNNSRLDFKDYTRPLVVGSCGTYRLKTRPTLPTFWQKVGGIIRFCMWHLTKHTSGSMVWKK